MDTNKKIDFTVNVKNITVPQAIALRILFEEMEHLGNLGGSRWVSYFADGDGNFRPRVSFTASEYDATIKEYDGKYKGKWESDEFKIDFDPIAWSFHKDV